MKVLIDKYIPFIEGVIEDLQRNIQVFYLAPEQFTKEQVKDADALIIRTRTRCDEQLLKGSTVRMIATATIGYDHIDTTYCQEHNIYWTACPGCNAQAVCNYVEEAITWLGKAQEGVKIGVVGVGHVGSRVVEMARRHGMEVIENDPLKGMMGNVSQCDIITYHVPLTCSGEYPTLHMCNEAWLNNSKHGALIINAARGGIVDEQALARSGHPYVIDCWENEPAIDRCICTHPNAKLTSYHIAGYSLEGKKNATDMCLRAFSSFFDLPILSSQKKIVPLPGNSQKGWLQRITDELKAHPERFEQLRKNYKLR